MAQAQAVAPGDEADVLLGGDTARCVGAWTLDRLAGLERRLPVLRWPEDPELRLDLSGVSAMDTAGAWLLCRTLRSLEDRGRRVALDGLRPEHRSLLDMVRVPDLEEALAPPPVPGFFERVGRRAWQNGEHLALLLSFVGETSLAALRALRHPARIRWRPILFNVRTAGYDALPITGLLVFLMGIVIAYQGAGQLRRYGANIFVADLVGLAMLRELSPLLTAIIVAGRSGSAYAAQIGTMKVTEEVDALRTVGIVPIELLVLPKIAALALALPLLTVYADVVGVAGGMLMAKTQLGVGYADFLDRLQHALRLSDYWVGLFKAPIFAAIIAVVGCFQGFRVSGDAESVGHRTTVSVVQSIFLVIVADAIFSVIFANLGI